MTASRKFAAAMAFTAAVIGWVAPAAAYRPFDGTDAAVADLGEMEIEFQHGLDRRSRMVGLLRFAPGSPVAYRQVITIAEQPVHFGKNITCNRLNSKRTS